MSKPKHRFDLRKGGAYTREIFDMATGRIVIVEGKAYCDLPLSADTVRTS